MSEKKAQAKARKAKQKLHRIRKRRRRRVGFWMLLSIVFLGGLMTLAGLSVSGRPLTAPQWLTNEAVSRINQNLPSGRVSLGRLALTVDERGVPHISLRNLGIFDDRGAEIARLNDVGARFSLRAILQGHLEPEVLRLNGAQVTVRRLEDGQFDLSFGQGQGPTGTLSGVLDVFDQAFDTGPLSGIQRLQADGLTITLEDWRSGRIWQITQGQLQLKQEPENLDISVSFDVFNGTEELARTLIGIRTDRKTSAASLGVSFENAAATDIALQSPVLSFLGVLDAPISGALRADFDPAGELDALAGTLEIGSGALQPSSATRPMRFDAGKAYFEFDPKQDKLKFSEIRVQSAAASILASGHAYLRDYQDGWPSVFLGQMQLADFEAQPEGLFLDPIRFSKGAVDFRLRLNPFTMDIGQLVLSRDDEKLLAKGTILAGESGWEIASDLSINRMDYRRLLALWPVSVVPRTRDWILNNVKTGTLHNIKSSARIKAGSKPRFSVGYEFADAEVTYIRSLPNIVDASGYSTIEGKSFALTLEKGSVVAPGRDPINMGGSSMKIEDVTIKPAHVQFSLNGQSTTTAALSLLNEPPFSVLKNTKYSPDVAKGNATFAADIAFDLKKPITLPDVHYDVTASLTDLWSQNIVKDRIVTADHLSLRANRTSVEIAGAANIGPVPAQVNWLQQMGPQFKGKSSVTGSVELSQAFVDEFGIGLPKGTVNGQGVGQFHLGLVKDQPTTFKLDSDLNRVGLNIPPLGWSKPQNTTGKLSVQGFLGERPEVEQLGLSASGLNVTGGTVTLNEAGHLKAATFARVNAGGWLDAPVTISGRGPGVAPAVAVQGGRIDIRKTSFAGGSSSGGGQGGPLSLNLDRLVVSEGIALTDFSGDFDTSSGMAGRFRARVNGKARVTGRLAPDKAGTAIRIQSENAGGVVRDAGVFSNAKKGSFDMTLRPLGAKGVYDGRLVVKNTRVVNAPALTEMLSAISIVGLIDQVNGPGIAFSDVEADFQLSPRSIRLTKSSAIGPSLGISLDGIYDLANSQMNMQGVLSPVYFLNGMGQIFSRRGEGLFGFTFRLSGPPDRPVVQVNPLSILTPGMFREIFRQPPPTVQK